jgi:Protein of unknown function (DUF2905)
MDLSQLGRVLIAFGAVLLVIGMLFVVGGRIPFLGRLPGDLVFEREGLTIFVPFATMLLLSVILTIVLNVVVRLFDRS